MVLMQGLPSSRPFAPAHMTKTSMIAAGNRSRKARISGVASRLSPMPAKEMTKMFIQELFAQLRVNFTRFEPNHQASGSGAEPAEPRVTKIHLILAVIPCEYRLPSYEDHD